MSETPEIPEADDRFSKRVAMSIAIIAVILTVFGSFGDNAKTDALVKSTRTANQWAYFQSKSIKESEYEIGRDALLNMSDDETHSASRAKLAESYKKKIEKYKAEKADIGFGRKDAHGHWVDVLDDKGVKIISAMQLQEETDEALELNDKIDRAVLFLQLAVVLCSIAILVKMSLFWFGGLAVGVIGAVLGALALLPMATGHEGQGDKDKESANGHAATTTHAPTATGAGQQHP